MLLPPLLRDEDSDFSFFCLDRDGQYTHVSHTIQDSEDEDGQYLHVNKSYDEVDSGFGFYIHFSQPEPDDEEAEEEEEADTEYDIPKRIEKITGLRDDREGDEAEKINHSASSIQPQVNITAEEEHYIIMDQPEENKTERCLNRSQGSEEEGDYTPISQLQKEGHYTTISQPQNGVSALSQVTVL